MTVGDFPALGYNGYWGTCPHGGGLGVPCWLCSNGVYAPLPSLTPPQGWQCPTCYRVMSPSMAMCLYCPATSPVVTMTTTSSINVATTADNADDEAGRNGLMIRLPEAMLREGHQQIRTLRAEWIEVFPGLQAKLADIESSPVDPPILLLRLTPSDEWQRD